jgi:hypothetical protein
MTTEIFTAIIAVAGSVVLAGSSYWFTKKREREAEIRKEKLEHYKEFVVCLSGVVSGESTPDAQRAFALVCNRLNLVAPQAVISALQEYQDEIKISNSEKSQEVHNKLMSKLFYAMRRDLQVTPPDNYDFHVALWASGVAPQKTRKIVR